jgi:hypothetical protein
MCRISICRGKTSDHWTCHMSLSDLLKLMEERFDRPLTQFEQDIANHPRVCMVSGKGMQLKCAFLSNFLYTSV